MEIASRRAKSPAFPTTRVPCDPLPASPFRAPRFSHLWSPASGDLRRSSSQPPPRPLWERSDFPDLPLQIGVGNPGEGCPGGRWVVALAKPAAPARPRRRALAGAARIDADGARRPAVSPSPGFAKLAIPKSRHATSAANRPPSETASPTRGEGERGARSEALRDPMVVALGGLRETSSPERGRLRRGQAPD